MECCVMLGEEVKREVLRCREYGDGKLVRR